MDTRANAFLRHRQARWLRPDAARWVRPDAARFLKAGTRPEDVYPALAHRRDRKFADAIAQERTLFAALRAEFDVVSGEWARRKAGRKYNADQPRVPSGNSDGGQWTSGGGGSGRPRVYIATSPDSEEVGDSGPDLSLPSLSFDFGDLADAIGSLNLFDIKPRKPRSGGAQLAGDVPDGLGAPNDKPPKVPAKRPQRSAQRTAVLRSISSWARANRSIAGHIIAGIIDTIDWLDDYADLLEADRDPPKTLQELQANISNRRPGYDIHHIIEQTAAERWGLTRSEIDDPSNLVSIPRLKHYQITGWYATSTEEFDGMSPRQYLSDKTIEERRQIGIYALTKFEVLKP